MLTKKMPVDTCAMDKMAPVLGLIPFGVAESFQ